FQAEDGIRDSSVTGVQTCALPVWRFVLGLYRRDMKVIGYLGRLDRVFGVPVTTRNWNTMEAIANAVHAKERGGGESGSHGAAERSEERRVGNGSRAQEGRDR